MNYWKDNGAPAEKLLVGFPTYRHTFLLRDPSNHRMGAPTMGPGPAGPYTRQSGFGAYYAVCSWKSARGGGKCHSLGHGFNNINNSTLIGSLHIVGSFQEAR